MTAPPDDGIPWITWAAGGAALLLLVGTAWLLLAGQRVPGARAEAISAVPSAPGLPTSATTASPAPRPERHPPDVSRELNDARTRGTLRFEPAALVGIRLIIEGGRPLGPLEVTYAKARERALPGAPVASQRLRISYHDGRATPVDEQDRKPARSVPDPNCPLEAAVRAAVQAGASAAARTFVVYAHSERHGRPIWTLTAATGGAYHVDGDNCALLRR